MTGVGIKSAQNSAVTIERPRLDFSPKQQCNSKNITRDLRINNNKSINTFRTTHCISLKYRVTLFYMDKTDRKSLIKKKTDMFIAYYLDAKCETTSDLGTEQS